MEARGMVSRLFYWKSMWERKGPWRLWHWTWGLLTVMLNRKRVGLKQVTFENFFLPLARELPYDYY